MEILLWAILIIAMIIVEISTFQFISIWFAVGGIFALISAAMGASFLIQMTVFVVASVILLILTLPLAKKLTNFKKTATNSELNIGQFATVIEEVNAEKGTGRVKLKGVDWTAISSDGSIIPKDSVVIVNKIKGTKLIVTLKDTATVS